MARAQTTDYYHVMKFQIVDSGAKDFIGAKTGGFNTLTMPEYTLDIAEYKEGIWTYRRKFPGEVTVSDVTMTRGAAKKDSAFHDWVVAGIEGNEYRTDLKIQHFHRDDVAGKTDYSQSTPSRTIDLAEALPMRVKPGSDFDSLTSDVSIQELDVAIERLTLSFPA